MSIRLIALDLDGTLLDSRGNLPERNRRAIERARGRGVRIALVTGRRFRDARPLALELGLDVPVIADHRGAGLLVYDHLSAGNVALARYVAWARRIHGPEADEAVRLVPSLEEYLDHDPVHVTFSGTCAAMCALSEALAVE